MRKITVGLLYAGAIGIIFFAPFLFNALFVDSYTVILTIEKTDGPSGDKFVELSGGEIADAIPRFHSLMEEASAQGEAGGPVSEEERDAIDSFLRGKTQEEHGPEAFPVNFVLYDGAFFRIGYIAS